MRRPIGAYGFAFNLPAIDPYEEQPPVVSFDLRGEDPSVQTQLSFLTFVALSSTPRGEAVVEGAVAQGVARFELVPNQHGEFLETANPFKPGYKVASGGGQRYTVVSTETRYLTAGAYADCVIVAEAPGEASNRASGDPLTVVEGDLMDRRYTPPEQLARPEGVALGAVRGGRDQSDGMAPIGSTLVVRDAREDAFAIAGAAADAYTPLWSRVPVRGPVQVELGLATTCTGYVEDEAPDVLRRLAPLWPTREGAVQRRSPLLVCSADGHVHLGDVPIGNQELSLYVHAPSMGSRVLLGYVPDDRRVKLSELLTDWQAHTVATIDVLGGQSAFVPVLDRIPVRGPGSLFAHVVTGGAPVTLYGLLSG